MKMKTKGLLTSGCGQIDCHSYPFIQVTPRHFCSMANRLLKKKLNRYCAGLTELVRWELLSDEKVDDFLQNLYCSMLSKYAGIGQKYATLIDSFVNNNSDTIDPKSPFILEKVVASATIGIEPHPDLRYWLLALDTRCDIGYELASEEWDYPSLTYNYRLHIDTIKGVHIARFMVDDIMASCFLIPSTTTEGGK